MKKEFSIKKNQEKSVIVNPNHRKTYSNHFYSRKNSMVFGDNDEGVQSPTLKMTNFSKSELKRKNNLRSTLVARGAPRSKRKSLRKNWLAP